MPKKFYVIALIFLCSLCGLMTWAWIHFSEYETGVISFALDETTFVSDPVNPPAIPLKLHSSFSVEKVVTILVDGKPFLVCILKPRETTPCKTVRLLAPGIYHFSVMYEQKEAGVMVARTVETIVTWTTTPSSQPSSVQPEELLNVMLVVGSGLLLFVVVIICAIGLNNLFKPNPTFGKQVSTTGIDKQGHPISKTYVEGATTIITGKGDQRKDETNHFIDDMVALGKSILTGKHLQ
jgi:hypothetical protein